MNKAFIVEMSTRSIVRIDSDEVTRVLEGIATGSVIRVRQGIINPSYIVSVIQDKERTEKFLEDTKYDKDKRELGVTKLNDIYDGIQKLAEKYDPASQQIATPLPNKP